VSNWSPTSWREFAVSQQPAYPPSSNVDRVLKELAALPPLVTAWEVDDLRKQLAEAAAGKRFVLHGGDCAESFGDCTAGVITRKIQILLQMSLVLVHGIQKPVVRIGRLAGQYAKPRSSESETRNGCTLPSYRGDIVNRPGFDAQSRSPDPELMLQGYSRAALTLNYVRSLARGGFADLHHPENWETGFIRRSALAGEYTQIVRNVSSALRFMENVLGVQAEGMNRVDFFTSHEGLLLPYEQAQTRECAGRWYNLSTHLPWIGARTLALDGAHVEYFRGISNAIGVKVSASLQPPDLLRLLDVLDPEREAGRITLIHRLGCGQIAACLPALVRAVQASGRTVLWACDPMHGNTRATMNGYKTRYFSDILSELEQAFDIHAAEGSALGGVHLELSGENVTECVGGSSGIEEGDLSRAYKSEVDPRLNCEQALELAMLIAHKLGGG
jgi:3-deoxy-7-phosphoheptulonate synthase